MIPTIDDVLNNLAHYTSPATVRINHPELYKNVIDLPYDNFSKKLYAFYYGGPKPCPICGKPTKYVNFRIGYRKYCSQQCASISPETVDARKSTNLKRYGVELPAQSIKVREKMEDTNLRRYGAKHAIQSEIIKNRVKSTNLKRYGVEWTGSCKDRISKVKSTNLKRYGVEWYMCADDFDKKSTETKLRKYGNPTYHNVEKSKQTRWNKTAIKYGALDYDGHTLLMPCYNHQCDACSEKNYSISLSMYLDRCKYGCELCTKLFPPHSMDYGVSAASQLMFNELDKTIFSMYDTYYHSKNKEMLVGKYKLDYCVPELKLCIEFYGDYWHANPKLFQPTDIPIPQFNKTAQEIWNYDESRLKYLESEGWRICIVWASDWQSGLAYDIVTNFLIKDKR